MTVTLADLEFKAPFTVKCSRNDYVQAFVTFFNIDFTACHTRLGFSTGKRGEREIGGAPLCPPDCIDSLMHNAAFIHSAQFVNEIFWGVGKRPFYGKLFNGSGGLFVTRQFNSSNTEWQWLYCLFANFVWNFCVSRTKFEMRRVAVRCCCLCTKLSVFCWNENMFWLTYLI